MCLILNENRLEPIVAPYNIICYKKLDSENYSYSYGFKYFKNVLNPKVEISPTDDGFFKNSIENGYHSRNENSDNHSNRIFMIPKDTKFYIGGENIQGQDNYVSETIVLLGRNNVFTRWYYKQKYKLKSYINDKTYRSI